MKKSKHPMNSEWEDQTKCGGVFPGNSSQNEWGLDSCGSPTARLTPSSSHGALARRHTSTRLCWEDLKGAVYPQNSQSCHHRAKAAGRTPRIGQVGTAARKSPPRWRGDQKGTELTEVLAGQGLGVHEQPAAECQGLARGTAGRGPAPR